MMKSIKVKGNDYIPVHERLKHFRGDETYDGWAIRLKVMNIPSVKDECLVRCRIIDELGQIRAEEWAHERTDTNITVNAVNHVENCCTSAKGRALGDLGIGLGEIITTPENEKPWMQPRDFRREEEELKKMDTTPDRLHHVTTLYEKYKVSKDMRAQFDQLIKSLTS